MVGINFEAVRVDAVARAGRMNRFAGLSDAGRPPNRLCSRSTWQTHPLATPPPVVGRMKAAERMSKVSSQTITSTLSGDAATATRACGCGSSLDGNGMEAAGHNIMLVTARAKENFNNR